MVWSRLLRALPRRRLGAQAAAAAGAGAALAGLAVRCEAEDKAERLKSWEDRWSVNRISWHLEDANPHLRKYLTKIIDPDASVANGMGPRILVPLCGKTVDMVYLARLGYRVVGVDGVRKAIEDFAKDFGLKVPTAKGPTMHVNFPPELEPSRFRGHAVLMPAGPEDGSRHEPPPPVIFVEGDFLGLGPEQAKALVPFEAAFDRGGFVAVEPCDRQLYADTLGHLMAPGGRILLVAVEHDGFAGGKRGPPYQVTAEEMQKYFGGRFALQRLGGAEALDEALRARGATRFMESVYLLTKK
ncbi:Thiopurine S-methyltransferase [Symbiodinium microadriaticum]|uniref:Thiopurine S-methyltransferase n=1 Tax=Symbiodinium microadriaticum TaxID=2951 RepID=A0A1Q9D882_SYMMI|nr:Thiopurine S-methyltransferase [Symbiodinium microadriaticum]